MKLQVYKFKENDIYIIPIGDVHIGDKCFNEESKRKLMGYIDWVKNTSNAFIFLIGDIVNCATLTSPSSPFQQNLTLKEQIDEAVKYFEPVKSKIFGAIDGNHEDRLERFSGYSPTISLCERLGIFYFGVSGVCIFRLGVSSTHRSRASFSGYFHHTTGGGSTPGGKMNRIDMLRKIVCDADFYAGAHNHLIGGVHTQVFKINSSTGRIETLRQMLVDTGGYLGYEGSYAEQKQLPPLKIGSPRIHLFLERKNGMIKKDIHVSI